MKLVYLWVDNYKGKISKQGFSFSSEYAVSFNDDKGILYINKNPNYIKDFWGKNILDVSAIVGENGSGKTTVAKCVYDLCGGIVPVDSWSKESVSKRVVVYLNEECGQTNKEQTMTVFFFWDKKISVEISPIDLLKVKCIDLYEIDKEQYLMAMKEHDMTATYFTNSFEASHITKNQGMTEYSEGDIRKTLCFSPMLSLNRGRISLRENYGAQLDSKGGLLDGIEKYAQQMCNDFKAAYISSNGYNFLMALRHCPGAIVNNLPVLRDFEVSITEFGEYLAYKKDWIRMNEFDKSVYFVRKNIYEHISKKMRKTIWADIYINILCEIALFLNVFNLTYKVIDFDLLEVEGIRMESADAFDFILNQIPNDDERIKEKNLTTRIRNVSSIDIDILEDFLELKSKRTCILSDTKWFLQVKHFTNSYNKLKNIQVNYTINDGYLEFIDLILDEFYNKEQVYGRMINIIPGPISSGESALINVFSMMYQVMKKQTEKNILLIVDEIDAFLHPRWQQEILTHIVRWINEGKEFQNKKVQLLIASHSPIILSDIPLNNVIHLKKFKVVKSEKSTFAANINLLFYDSFFMDNGSIGEFAKTKLKQVIEFLDNPCEDEKMRKEVLYIIENIGEPYVKKKLQNHPNYLKVKGDI